MSFADGSILYYSDIRQFGWWRLMPTMMSDALCCIQLRPEGVGTERITVEDLGRNLPGVESR
jgi:hypothetical protein